MVGKCLRLSLSFLGKLNPSIRKKGVPLIATYQPILNCFSKITRKNLYLMYMNDKVKRAFFPKPIISFRSERKLCNYLVRAKICPIERSVGSFGKNAAKYVEIPIKLKTLLKVSLSIFKGQGTPASYRIFLKH